MVHARHPAPRPRRRRAVAARPARAGLPRGRPPPLHRTRTRRRPAGPRRRPHPRSGRGEPAHPRRTDRTPHRHRGARHRAGRVPPDPAQRAGRADLPGTGPRRRTRLRRPGRLAARHRPGVGTGGGGGPPGRPLPRRLRPGVRRRLRPLVGTARRGRPGRVADPRHRRGHRRRKTVRAARRTRRRDRGGRPRRPRRPAAAARLRQLPGRLARPDAVRAAGARTGGVAGRGTDPPHRRRGRPRGRDVAAHRGSGGGQPLRGAARAAA